MRKSNAGRPTHRVRIAVVGAAACVLAVAACGRKTDVRPPGLVVPRGVTDLAVVNTDDGIDIRWKRPTRYVDGTQMLDLAGFSLERRRAGCAFLEIENIPVDDQGRFRRVKSFRYLDTDLAPDETYDYRVIAVTVDNYQSAPTNPVGVRRPSDTTGDDTEPTADDMDTVADDIETNPAPTN